ncbi:O-acyltransferase like protein-like [Pseudophryne corroboree]|uniref:O-acyltransferase like protein-like n=1 Tax=Pseudophryne corroboree TaxID=495146 RepID=UPI003081FB58
MAGDGVYVFVLCLVGITASPANVSLKCLKDTMDYLSDLNANEPKSYAFLNLFQNRGASFLASLPNFVIQNGTGVTVAETVCSRGLFPADSFAIVCLCLSGLLLILPVIGSIYTAVLSVKASSSFAQCEPILSHKTQRAEEQPAVKSNSPPDEGYRNEKTQNNPFEWKSRVLEKPVYFYTLSGPVYLGVDTFFFLSGFLGAKSFLKVTEQSGNEATLAVVMRYVYRRLRRAKRVMFAAVTLIFLTCTIATTLLSFFLKLSIRYPRGESQSRMNYWVEYYTKPYCRYGPFLVGIILAIMLSKEQITYVKNRMHAVTGWLTALLIIVLVMALAFILDDTPTSYSIMAALYQGVHRSLWAVALALVLVLCHEGYGGHLNKMLSCSMWSILSRISYACYMVHPIIIILYCGLQETLFHYQDINMLYLFVGHSVLTFIAGLVLTVLIERPFQQLLLN